MRQKRTRKRGRQAKYAEGVRQCPTAPAKRGEIKDRGQRGAKEVLCKAQRGQVQREEACRGTGAERGDMPFLLKSLHRPARER